jgi:glycosyltransferase involved in cell wall biosynthesis
MKSIKYSIIIPIYKNEDSIHKLLVSLNLIQEKLSQKIEVVFVIDGSPDRSYLYLKKSLNKVKFSAQLICHSRNFGALAAVRTGLAHSRGAYFAIMAGDLQDPPELIVDFFKNLSTNKYDVIIGTRSGRFDPLISKLFSNFFWMFYKKFVIQEMPRGGVDVFAGNLILKSHLVKLDESRSSLVGLIFWLGFRRKEISYIRKKRYQGESSWTFEKKINYMMDSFFSFTDYPIKLLINVGFIGSISLLLFSIIVLFSKIKGHILISGYATIILFIALLGAINLLGLGLVGSYAWRAYENSKGRPLSVVASKVTNNK